MTDKPHAIEKIVSRAICKSRKFETGEGTCALLCMDQLGYVRDRCRHVLDVHGEMTHHILDALDAAGLKVVPVEATEEMDEAGLDDPHGDYCDRCMYSGHSRNSGWPGVVWEQMIAAFDPATWKPRAK